MTVAAPIELPPHRIETRRIADLVPADYNPRKIGKKALAGLSASIAEFGAVQPVIVNERTGNIVGGHQRVKALAALGQVDTDVVVVDLSPARERALNVALNNPAIAGEFSDGLGAILGAINAEMPGLFADLRLDDLLETKGSRTSSAIDDDEGSETSGESGRVKAGDVWQLGRHRLVAGDSMADEVVALALDGRIPGVTIVDPPYELGEPAYSRFITDPCIIFGPPKCAKWVPDDLYRFDRMIYKSAHHRFPSLGLCVRHAVVIQVGSKSKGPDDKSLAFDSVVAIGIGDEVKPGEGGGKKFSRHGKPAALLIEHLANWTPAWDMVFDPFIGTGTSIIAAERMGKACCGVEMDPQRCHDVIERWERETGGKATRE